MISPKALVSEACYLFLHSTTFNNTTSARFFTEKLDTLRSVILFIYTARSLTGVIKKKKFLIDQVMTLECSHTSRVLCYSAKSRGAEKIEHQQTFFRCRFELIKLSVV